jgi:hypothetical protein
MAPTTVWTSSGGGSAVGPASRNQLGLSIGGTPVVGTATGQRTTNSVTFGDFCEASVK